MTSVPSASQVPNSTKQDSVQRSALTMSAERIFFVFILVLLVGTLAFGAVHELPRLCLQTLIPALALLAGKIAGARFGRAPALSACLALMACYVITRSLVEIFLLPTPIPLGAPSAEILTQELLSFLAQFTLFWSCFELTLGLREHLHSERLVRALAWVSVVVVGVALSQWLTDNGRLLWIFEPENVFRSTRARWPFVNPNHLAHFILPLFFIAFGEFVVVLRRVERHFERRKDWTWARVAQALGEPELQKQLRPLGFTALLLVALGLTILATQSRGAWIASLAGLTLFFVVNFRTLSRHKRSPSPTRRYVLIAVIAVFILSLGVTLMGGGGELIAQRADRALETSGRDLRWSLYEHSGEALLAHPLFGAGVGRWEKDFFATRTADLTGFRPGFLHSDPLQLIYELGVVGALPLITFLWLVLRGVRRRLQNSSLRRSFRYRTLTTFLGLLGVLIASLFDFPFRIPAIVALFGIVSGHLVSQTEIIHKKENSEATG